ncbi:hypothetical protein BB560_000584 [Smittium megazygosporum]|uniref:Uncharacterized protein n=1 Tax=Smittium megazygosporum TaxID=133381 RepID=A0A2T9ZK19_9FUNG|nr:hypothetical protein BB560_000584 [Smittium megazygosporum]
MFLKFLFFCILQTKIKSLRLRKDVLQVEKGKTKSLIFSISYLKKDSPVVKCSNSYSNFNKGYVRIAVPGPGCDFRSWMGRKENYKNSILIIRVDDCSLRELSEFINISKPSAALIYKRDLSAAELREYYRNEISKVHERVSIFCIDEKIGLLTSTQLISFERESFQNGNINSGKKILITVDSNNYNQNSIFYIFCIISAAILIIISAVLCKLGSVFLNLTKRISLF